MLHLDEARHGAVEALQRLLEGTPKSVRAVLIDDLFGHLRVVLWPGKQKGSQLLDQLKETLQKAAGIYWSGEIWDASEAGDADRLVYQRAWEEAAESEVVPGKLRSLLRHRNRGAWLSPLVEPPWSILERATAKKPPVVAFYSFKGGVGRSTALASFAIQQARQGERVVVIDADLDAPGVGSLLAADAEGTMANWGVIDYLLERPLHDKGVDLSDYYHACRREAVSGSGEILVFPAGRLDDDYLGKLARIDLEPPRPNEDPQLLHTLLREIREQLSPAWILVDVRAGLADPAGLILTGVAHLHLLFGTFSEQSWRGLRLVIQRFGAKRVQAGKPQADCLLVQAMVPRGAELSRAATAAFFARALDEFTEHYYAAEGGSDLWTVDDVESSDAPHVPVPLPYDEQLAQFKTIDDVADLLNSSPDYRALATRILDRFGGGS